MTNSTDESYRPVYEIVRKKLTQNEVDELLRIAEMVKNGQFKDIMCQSSMKGGDSLIIRGITWHR